MNHQNQDKKYKIYLKQKDKGNFTLPLSTHLMKKSPRDTVEES